MSRRAAGVLLVLASLTGIAHADGNVVQRVEAKAEGDKTTVIVHGTATPSFTAYRLEKPARLVVDLANGQLADNLVRDGLIDVDSWAVSQIATAQFKSEHTKTARVMIALKRGVTYDAKPRGNDLYVMVTATDPAPKNEIVDNSAAIQKMKDAERAAADAQRAAQLAQTQRSASEAQMAQTEARRAQVLAQLGEEEKRLSALRDARAEEERREKKAGDAQKAEADAERRAEMARAEADTAKARAIAARAEVERLQVTRAAEEQRVAELQRRATQGGQSATTAQKELNELRAAAEKEQARLAQLKLEAEKLAAVRASELKKIDDAQAQQRVAADKKQKALEDARLAAEQRSQIAEQTRLAEERRAQARAEEASRLSSVAASQQKLASSEAAQKQAELAANKAAERAKADEQRIAQYRAEGEKVAAQAELARAQVEAARAEMARLVESQQRERARLESSRLEAKRLADQRQLEMERAAHATAMVSGERAKIEAAEIEAKRLADLRMKESQRLEAVRQQAEEAAAMRTAELKKMDDARASQKATVAAHERELKTIADRRDRELAALAEARAGEEAKIAAARDEVTRTKGELSTLETQRHALEQQRDADRAAVQKARAELAAQKNELSSQRNEAQRDMDAKKAEREALEKRLADARAELAKAEARAKQAAVDADAAQKRAATVVAVKTEPKVEVLAPKTKELARQGKSVLATVRDVRFADDADVNRIVIDVAGEPEWRTTPSQKGELTLSLKGAELPPRLERTLDTGAYKGPVKSISTYADPNDSSAVKIVVAIDSKAKGGEPRITKEGDKLVWEFPRETKAMSIEPTRVGGYTASVPLQVGSASSSLPAPQTGRRRASYSGRRIDLDFKDFDIHNILRLLSDVGQVNIITSDDVKGTITIRMRDVPWDQALDVILKAKGLGMQREGNLIRVAPLKQLEQELEAELARAKAAVELKPLDTRLIPLSYAKGDAMLPRVQELLSSRGKVSVDERTNMLIVSDVAANIALAEDLVRNLDTPTPEVLIEARIVEASQNFTRTAGIQWGGNTFNSASTGNATGLVFPSTVGIAGAGTDSTAPTAGLQGAAATNPNYVVNLPAAIGTGSGGGLGITLGSLSGAYNINLRLSALESTGSVRIVSAPKIMTLDNVEASIETGTAIPISVVSAAGTNTIFVDAKLNLTVKPHVTNEGSVAMSLAVTRNEPNFAQTGARGDPTITKRQAKTELLVRDGDTAVIGGIYTRNSSVSYQKLPWVADIPILGWLFKNKSETDDRTELLVFITPRIVNRQMVAR